ncbi:hypothetical protein [Aeromonas hydrophila]|uniref:hypothetical protein n=1 Tax=Aeromonas hydrophila TaxID=644 RepID=UPI0030169A9F
MRKILLGELFGIAVSRPIELDNIVKIVEIIPEVVIDQANVGGKTFDDAMSNVISEVLNFSEQLEPDESEIFLELFESECSTRMIKSVDNDFEIIDPSETKWKFYIRFKVSQPLGIEQDSICFLNKYTIKPDRDQSFKDSDILVLTTSDSCIYREIISESKKVEQALILSFAEMGIGIAYPKNLASEAMLEKLKGVLERSFFRENTDVYETHYERPLIYFTDKFGIELYQENSAPWDSKATEEKSPKKTDDFEQVFSKNYSFLRKSYITDHAFKKVDIATSILTTSIFEDSLINKIILSMTVIEVLSDKMPRTDQELQVLDYLKSAMEQKPDIDDKTKASLSNALDSIRFQSISKSCKALVKNLLGGKDAKLFYKLYDYRSQLVHAGTLKNDRDEMLKIYSDSFDLAKRLLTVYLTCLDEQVEI